MVIHTVSVRNRVLDINPKSAVQYNVNNDLLALDLDDEWQGKEVYIIFGSGGKAIAYRWDGVECVPVPPQVMDVAGYHEVTILGVSKEDDTRLVTEKSPRAFKVNTASDVIGAVKNV